MRALKVSAMGVSQGASHDQSGLKATINALRHQGLLGTAALGQVREHLPTRFAELNTMLGGGAPRGALTELLGQHTTGRTSIALGLLAEATQRKEVVAWIDPTDALDPLSLETLGGCLNRLLWVRPQGQQAFKQALQAADMILGAGGFGLVVLDLTEGKEQRLLANKSWWLRLCRRLEKSRTVMLVLSTQSWAEGAAFLRLQCCARANSSHGARNEIRVEVQRRRDGPVGVQVTLHLDDPVDWPIIAQ